jgi:hypothetical protein
MSPMQTSMGGVSSTTSTSKEQLDSFPEESVAVQVTVVVPRGKKLPEAWLRTTEGDASQASRATGSGKFARAPGCPSLMLQSTRTGPCGQTMSGGLVSITIILKEQEELFPELSAAVQRTTVSPPKKRLPEGGSQTTDGEASHASVAVTSNETGVPPFELHSTARS